MADQIMWKWKLAALHVALDLSERTPQVRSRLAGFIDGQEQTFWERTDRLEDFGLDVSADVQGRLRMPSALSRAVEDTMGAELRAESALWLRLEPPYGYLGAAPWEQLGERIRIPVIRVPDHLPVSVRLGRMHRIAVIVTQPPRARWGAAHARALAQALDERIPGVAIELFPDASVAVLLRDERLPASVTLHDPAHAPTTAVRITRGPRSVPGLRSLESDEDPRLLWMEWITGELADRAVSAVHVAAVGIASAERSMLAVAGRPGPDAVDLRGSVDADDLWFLADMLGASTVSVASPEPRRVDVGARMVADRLGQLRPGPTLFSSIRQDPDATALADIHSFLASREERQLPSDPSWFGYLQPEAIVDALDAPTAEPDQAGAEAPLLRAILLPGVPAASASRMPPPLPPPSTSLPEPAGSGSYEELVEVPRWAASASRFIETRQAEMISRASSEETPAAQTHETATGQALADIQSLVQRHLGGT